MSENKFLAKSNGETIIEHTEELIKNFEILLEFYPNIRVDKKLLLLACIYHDLGKINLKFQEKLHGSKKQGEIPHGLLSTAFINSKELSKNPFNKEYIKILSYAVALHHERDFFEITETNFKNEIELMSKEINNFENELQKLEKIYFDIIKKIDNNNKINEELEYSIFKKEDKNIKIKQLSERYYKLGKRIYSEEAYKDEKETLEIFEKYVMLKGLLNRIDYAASSHSLVEEKNDFLEDKMEKFLQNVLKKDNPNNDWNELQKFMKKNQDKNIVVVAQTGYGKTEAGLLWIGDNKGFFTLPLRVAINSIYDRLKKDIIVDNIENRLGLLHSDFRERYIDKNDNKNLQNSELAEYMNRTKQLSLPLTICTIDQLFDFVFRAAGFELKVATLSYSKLVIDEIQMYSANLLAYLIYGLKYITNFGGKFTIMTATLPGIVTQLLDEEGVEYTTTKPFTNDKKRHSIKVIKEKIYAEFIKEKYKNNKVLVVCNTVKKSKEIYEQLENIGINTAELNLIHSRFIKKDRAKKEEEISIFASPKRFKENIKSKREKNGYKENGIWIGTQVLEASLDLDFDILITELSDLNGLFQRMGRCYRSRDKKDEEYNCYIFTKECSGMSGRKSVIDKEIHIKSKEELERVNEGILSEKEKLDLIDKVYSYESLKDTKYFKEVKDNIKYLKDYIVEYDKSKAEVQKIFRNIASIDVIPKKIYEKYQDKIDKDIEILDRENKGLSEKERNDLRFEKIEARGQINQYKVAIPDFEYMDMERNMNSEIIVKRFNKKRENIIIVNCDYSYEKGVEFTKKERNFDEDCVF